MFTGPNIKTDGMVLWIDAGNPKCFTSGSDTCKNLVTGGTLTGASGTPGTGSHTPNSANFPAYNSLNQGIFDFSGGRGMNCEEDLGTYTESTLCMWIYKTNSGETDYIADARNDTGTWFLSNYNSFNINYSNELTYNFGGSYNASNPEFLNQWYYLCATCDSGGSTLYLNSDFITTGTNYTEGYGVNFRIGVRYTTSGEWTGYMGPVYIYDHVLSTNQIQKNYNSQKNRFGL